MKLFGIKENIIAFALAAVFVAGGAGALTVRAAGCIDKSATVHITAQVGSEDNTIFAQSYNGKVDIDLYKIAVFQESGEPLLTDSFKNSGIELGVLKDAPKVADIEKKIVEPAIKAIEGKKPDALISASRQKGTFSGNVAISAGAGIYLYVPKSASDDKYKYDFVPYVIMAPSSDYVTDGAVEEKWNYEVSFIIKPQATPINVNIPEEPTPTHGDDIVGFGEDVIEIGSELVPLAGGSPKTGDEILPLVACGAAFILGLVLLGIYFKMVFSGKREEEQTS